MTSLIAPLIISGYLTFWTRSSSQELPRPLGPSQKIAGTLSPTQEPGTTTRYREHFKGPELEGDFQMFYMQPKEGKAYIITQIDLYSATTSEPLGQCSSFHSIEDSTPLPVGSCSVFLKKGETRIQTGITFSRISY